MIAWSLVCALYIIGAIFTAITAYDLNGGPIKTKWKRYLPLVWPFAVLLMFIGDLCDAARGNPPGWLGGRQ